MVIDWARELDALFRIREKYTPNGQSDVLKFIIQSVN